MLLIVIPKLIYILTNNNKLAILIMSNQAESQTLTLQDITIDLNSHIGSPDSNTFNAVDGDNY